MARPRQGIAFEQAGVVYTGIRLEGGKRWVRPVAELVPPPAGTEVSIEWARIVSRELQKRYDDTGRLPQPRAATTAPSTPPAPLTVLEAARRWIPTLPEAQGIDDGRRIEAYLPRAQLGALALDAVTPADVRVFVAWLIAQPSRRKGTLAPRTVRNAFDVVRRMYAWASSEDVHLVSSSPCAVAPENLPAIVDKDREFRANAVFTREELRALCTDARVPEDRRVLWALLFLTGCRVGEVAALRLRHFTPDVQPLGRLLVANSIERETRQEKSTKSGIAREVPVHPSLAIVLRRWLAGGWSALMGREPKPDDFLIPSREGVARSTRHSHNKLQDDLARLGFRPRRVHDLRRSFVTLARDDGARGEVLRHITHGQSKSSMMDVYSSLAWATYCREISCLRFELADVAEGSVTGSVTSAPSTSEGETKNAANLSIHSASYGRGGRDLNPAKCLEESPSARNCSSDTSAPEHFETLPGRFVTGSVTTVTLVEDVRRALAEATERGWGWTVGEL